MKKINAFMLVLTISTGALAQTAPVIVAQPSSTPYTVYTPSGSYLVVPNYSTGQPSAVIQVGTSASGNTTTNTNTGGSRR